MDAIVTVFSFALLLLILDYVVNIYLKRKKFYVLDEFPGNRWFPIVGNSYVFFGLDCFGTAKVFKNLNRQYGPTYRMWFGVSPSLQISKVEHVEKVLKKHTQKGLAFRFLAQLAETGLNTIDSSAEWKLHRKIVTSTLHFKALEHYQKFFTKNGQNLVDRLQPKANGEIFNIWDDISSAVLDVVLESSLGTDKIDYKLKTAFYDVLELVMKRTLNVFYHSDFIFKLTKHGKRYFECIKYLNDYAFNVMKDREIQKPIIAENELNEEDKLTGINNRRLFLDTLLENNLLSNQNIKDEIITFVAAAYDTTTSSISWTLLALASKPEIQDKVHEELDSVFNGEDRPITSNDLNQLQYLERVYKEVLRYITIVPILSRRLFEDIEIDGKIIPAGVAFAIHIWELHKDPNHWVDPEKFDPDRFLPENSIKRHPYAYIPFAAGPRNCVGQKFGLRNAKTLLAHIFRKYKVRSNRKFEDIDKGLRFISVPKGGALVSLELRK